MIKGQRKYYNNKHEVERSTYSGIWAPRFEMPRLECVRTDLALNSDGKMLLHLRRANGCLGMDGRMCAWVEQRVRRSVNEQAGTEELDQAANRARPRNTTRYAGALPSSEKSPPAENKQWHWPLIGINEKGSREEGLRKGRFR